MIQEEEYRYQVRPERSGGYLQAIMVLLLCLFLSFAATEGEASTHLSVQEILDEARAEGAIVVECRKGKCYDVDTEEPYDFVGQDGLYIVYPIDQVSPDTLIETGEKVKAATK
jgi:hypothetical protein